MNTQPILPADDLVARYPLPAGTSRLERFSEIANVDDVRIHLSGLAAEFEGECVTGSAADLCETPFFRAHMELVERIAVLVAMRRMDAPITLCDFDGNRIGLASASHVFPESPDAARWRWARSNGVAVGTVWRDAAARAKWELVERDRVLRSFYGEIEPRRIPFELFPVPHYLRASYEFRAYSFGTPFDHSCVTGLFGFPRGGAPLVYGFGCRATAMEAARTAASECVQRLGFLAGEPLPDVAPPPSPTPDFHQEHYLFVGHHERIRRWLDGEHARYRGRLHASGAGASDAELFADLTPPGLVGKLCVAKALPSFHVPLVFGVGHPWLAPNAPDELAVHPIA